MSQKSKENAFNQNILMYKPAYEVLYNVARSLDFKGFFVFQFLVTVINTTQVLLLPFYYISIRDKDVGIIITYLMNIVDPTIFMTDYIHHIQFTLTGIILVMILQFFISSHVVFKKDSKEWIMRFVYISHSVIVNVFSIPIFNVLIRALACEVLDGTFNISFGEDLINIEHSHLHTCLESPYNILVLFSVIWSVFLFVYAFILDFFFMNTLFDLTPFCGVSSGRYSVIQRTSNFLVVISYWFMLASHESRDVYQYVYFGICISSLFFTNLYMYLVLPFHNHFRFLASSSKNAFGLFGFIGALASSFLPIKHFFVDYRFGIILVSGIVGLVLNFFAFIARYFILILRLRKWHFKHIISTKFLSQYEALALLATKFKKEKEFLELFLYLSNKVFPNSARIRIFGIFQMISNKHNPTIIKREISNLINDSRGTKKMFFDTSFFLYFLKQHIKEIDFAGDGIQKLRDRRIVSKELRKIRRYEKYIQTTRKNICGNFMFEKVFPFTLSTHFSSIRELENTVENMYKRLLKDYDDNPLVLRSYGKYLYESEMNPVLAETYFKKAKEQEDEDETSKITGSEEIDAPKRITDSESSCSTNSDNSDKNKRGSGAYVRSSDMLGDDESSITGFSESNRSERSRSIGRSSTEKNERKKNKINVKKLYSTKLNSYRPTCFYIFFIYILFTFVICVAGIFAMFFLVYNKILEVDTRSNFLDDLASIRVHMTSIASDIRIYDNYFFREDERRVIEEEEDEVIIFVEYNKEYVLGCIRESVIYFNEEIINIYKNYDAKSYFRETVTFENETKTLLDTLYVFYSSIEEVYEQFSEGKEKNEEDFLRIFQNINFYENKLRNLVDNVIKSETESDVFQTQIMGPFWYVLLIPILFIFVFFIYFQLQEINYFKSLLSILPKSEVYKIFKRNNGKDEEIKTGINNFASSGRSGIFTISGSTIFLFVLIIVLVSGYLYLLISHVYQSLTIVRTTHLTREVYDQYYGINFWARELLEFKNSMHTYSKQEVLENLHFSVVQFRETIDTLRFGDSKNYIMSFDENDYFCDVLYENIKRSTNETELVLENISYYSMNWPDGCTLGECYSFAEIFLLIETSAYNLINDDDFIEAYYDLFHIVYYRIFEDRYNTLIKTLEENRETLTFPSKLFNWLLMVGGVVILCMNYLLNLISVPQQLFAHFAKIKSFILYLPSSFLNEHNMQNVFNSRKVYEKGLRKMEEKEYHQLFDVMIDYSVVLFNEKGKVFSVNKNACAMFGISKEEFLRKDLTDIFDISIGVKELNSIRENSQRSTLEELNLGNVSNTKDDLYSFWENEYESNMHFEDWVNLHYLEKDGNKIDVGNSFSGIVKAKKNLREGNEEKKFFDRRRNNHHHNKKKKIRKRKNNNSKKAKSSRGEKENDKKLKNKKGWGQKTPEQEEEMDEYQNEENEGEDEEEEESENKNNNEKGVYDLFPVHVSVSRSVGKGLSFQRKDKQKTKNSNKKRFMCIIRNIESEERQKQLIEDEKKHSDQLLYNILPVSIANKFRNNEDVGFEVHNEVSSIFIDIVGFTKFAKQYKAEFVVEILNNLFVGIDDLCDVHKIEKIKTMGDCYFACCGVPNYVHSNQRRTFLFARDVLKFVYKFNYDHKIDFHVKIGLNCGKLTSGVIGKKKWCYDVWGDSINLASRLQTTGEKDKIHVSRAIYSFLYKDFQFEEKMTKIKGIGHIRTYFYSLEKEEIEKLKKGEIQFDNSDIIIHSSDEEERMEFRDLSNTPRSKAESVYSSRGTSRRNSRKSSKSNVYHRGRIDRVSRNGSKITNIHLQNYQELRMRSLGKTIDKLERRKKELFKKENEKPEEVKIIIEKQDDLNSNTKENEGKKE